MKSIRRPRVNAGPHRPAGRPVLACVALLALFGTAAGVTAHSTRSEAAPPPVIPAAQHDSAHRQLAGRIPQQHSAPQHSAHQHSAHQHSARQHAQLDDRSAAAPTRPYGVWPDSVRPRTPADPEARWVQLGVRFHSSIDGWVTGIRFYKSRPNVGPHTGFLWSADGTRLASVSFTSETAHGWQAARFTRPVRISSHTAYVASYVAPQGRYADDQWALSASNPASRFALTAVGSVYTYTHGLPTANWRHSNYYVDVLFTTDKPPAATSAPPPSDHHPTSTTPAPSTRPTSDAPQPSSSHHPSPPTTTSPPPGTTTTRTSAPPQTSATDQPPSHTETTAPEPTRPPSSSSVTRSPQPTTTAPTTTVPTTTAPTTRSTTRSSRPTTSTAPPQTTAATTSAPAGAVPLNCAPHPSACGYPDATNTGVPQGTTLKAVPGDITSGQGWHWDSRGWIAVSGDGAVLDGISTTASIDVTADNVTIKNSKITVRGEGWGIAARHTTNLVIENNDISGPVNSGPGRLMVGIKDIYGDSRGMRVLANNIWNTSTGVQIESGLIQDNYIHDLGYKDGDHINGTTSNGGSRPLTIRHNTVLNKYEQTDAISLFQDFGVQANRTIDDNLLAGGGYTIYAGGGDYGTAQNITITNNRFSRMFFDDSGYYGPVTAFDRTGNTWDGNFWDDTGRELRN